MIFACFGMAQTDTFDPKLRGDPSKKSRSTTMPRTACQGPALPHLPKLALRSA